MPIDSHSSTLHMYSVRSPPRKGASSRSTSPAAAAARQRSLSWPDCRACLVRCLRRILIVGGIVWNAGALPIGEPRAPILLAFSHVRPSTITATVEVVPQPEGTDFRVECQYAANGGHPSEAYATYGIWIVDRSGSAVEAKTWPAKPNRVMRPEAHSPLKVSRISHVEIRNEAGEILLRANLR
jgi:hypothetical protein